MEYKNQIIKSIKYIENNLEEKLTNKSCSQACGYSEFHFIKVFKGVVGFTPMDYIRKRRLLNAAVMLIETDMLIFDIAFRAGYNSQENFIRSFKSEHGITPNAYRKTRNSLHLIEPYSNKPLHDIDTISEPIIKEIEEKRICCHIFETNAESLHHDIPKFWNIYNKSKMYLNLSDIDDCDNRIDYGWLEKTTDNKLNYWIGCESNYSVCDQQYKILTIPAGCYAIFSTPKADAFTFVEVIHKTWNFINSVWLKENNVTVENEYAYECYCENSRSYIEKIIIPIGRKGEQSYES